VPHENRQSTVVKKSKTALLTENLRSEGGGVGGRPRKRKAAPDLWGPTDPMNATLQLNLRRRAAGGKKEI